ncbi:MAG: S8 family serine peptidase [Flavobacteriales bacterium]|nr:S8 family serine peptidase [Flavobacteriales bacterium]
MISRKLARIGPFFFGVFFFLNGFSELCLAQNKLPEDRQLIVELVRPVDGLNEYAICLSKGDFQILGIEKMEPVFKSGNAALANYVVLHFISETARDRALEPLRKCNAIRSVEEVPVYDHFYTPNDLQASQWALKKIKATQAWDRATGAASVVLAVVDDAVYIDHEDLKPVLWMNTAEIPGNGIDDDGNGYIDDLNGWDAHLSMWDPRPDSMLRINGKQYHGTHVAGIAAAATDNNLGIASVSFNVSLMSIKASYSSGGVARLSTLALLRGIEYAVVNNARVINMSWGGKGRTSAMQAVLNMAHDSGVVLVAAAGNDGRNSMATWANYPAAYDHVIAVGSTDSMDRKSDFSSYYSQVDVMAPGSEIYSCLARSSSSYGFLNGTSMASPLVAGLCALMLSKNSSLNPDDVEQCLKSSCDDISSLNSSYSGGIGAGRINVQKAIECFKAVIARFEAENQQICPGSSVRYKNHSFGKALSYAWTFPGGTPGSSTSPEPVITYSSSGTFTARLIASNGKEWDTLELKNVVKVAEPSASIETFPDTLYAGQNGLIGIKLNGRAPFEIAMRHANGIDTLRNIGTPYFYYPIRPNITSQYDLVYVMDAGCLGQAQGTAKVVVVEFNWNKSVSLNCINVLRHQKISQTEGGFKGSLHDNNVFGHEMDVIGDVDGDGTDDLAVGAVWDNDGGTRKGAFFVLFMNPDGTVKAHQKISEKSGGFNSKLDVDDRFGHAIEGLGDLNGDNIPDLLVGAPLDDDGGNGRGACYILCLNRDGTVKRESKISSLTNGFTNTLSNGDGFGQRAILLGDVNGDGNLEIAISSIWDDDGGSDRGAVYILSIDKDGNVKGKQKISSTQGNFKGNLENNDYFSSGMCVAGDLDKDGVVDILVSARGDDDGGSNRGAVYVLFLTKNLTVKSYNKISSTSGGLGSNILDDEDNFGISIDALGDINGGGRPVFAVGAFLDDDGGKDLGAVYLISLDNNGTVHELNKISTQAGHFNGDLDQGDNFGWGMTTGDLDKNGIPELFVGAELDDDGGTNRGAVWMLDLGSTCEASCLNIGLDHVLSATQGYFKTNFDGSDRFGCSLSPAGDWDKNGYADYFVGAKHRDEGGIKRGAVYLLLMGQADSVIDFRKYSGTNSAFGYTVDDYDDFGNAVSVIGDIDNDGIPELAVGTPADDDGGFGKGAVYILFTDNSGNLRKASKISSSYGGLGSLPSDARFGTSVYGVGDVDNDGIPDLAVGAPRYNNVGAVLILTLKADGSVKNKFLLSHQTGGMTALDAEDYFGCSIASPGDVDGNGVPDLLVGAKRDDDGAVNSGAFYLIFLNSSIAARKVIKISNSSPNFSNVWEQEGLSAENLSCKLFSGGVLEVFSSQAYRELNDYGGVFTLSFDTTGSVRDYQILDRFHKAMNGRLAAEDRFGGGITYTQTSFNSGRLLVGADFTDHGGTDNGALYFFTVRDTCLIEPAICEFSGQIAHSEPCISDSLQFSYTAKGASNETLYDVKWSFGDGGGTNGLGPVNHQFPGPGKYRVDAEFYVLKDDRLCRDTASLTLTLFDTLIITLPDADTVCRGNSVLPLPGLLSCSRMTDKIQWTPNIEISGDTLLQPTITATRSRWYYVDIMSLSGLRQRDSIFIFVDTGCCPSITRIAASETQICQGGTVRFQDSSERFGNSKFTWNFGSNAIPSTYTGTNPGLIRFTQSGLYKIRLIKDDDCGLDTAYHELIVASPPNIPEFQDTALCFGDSLYISLPDLAVGQFFDWSPRGILKDTLGNRLKYIAQSDQTFHFTVTDVFSSCSSTDSMRIKLRSSDLRLLGSDTSYCQNSAVDLVVSDTTAQGYVWSTGATSPRITVNSEGWYWVEHSSPCLSRDSVFVKEIDLPALELGPDISTCDSSNVPLSNKFQSSNVSYQWSTGELTEQISVSATGRYSLVLDSAGCRASDSVYVQFNRSIPFSLGADTAICPDSRFTLDYGFLGADDYSWSDGTKGPQLITSSEGKYWLKVVQNGCVSSDTLLVRFKDCNCRVLYPSAFTPDRTEGLNDTYQPYVECPISESKLTIYNRLGVVVFSSEDPKAKWDGTYKGEPALPGVYAVEFHYALNRGSFLERHFDYSRVLLVR